MFGSANRCPALLSEQGGTRSCDSRWGHQSIQPAHCAESTTGGKWKEIYGCFTSQFPNESQLILSLLLNLHVKLRLCQVCHKRSSLLSLVGHINTFFCVKYQMPTHTDLCSTTRHCCLCPFLLLLSTGCQKSHRIGGSHGETENEGWSETGEQYIMSSRCHEEFQIDCILVVVSSLKSELLHYLL